MYGGGRLEHMFVTIVMGNQDECHYVRTRTSVILGVDRYTKHQEVNMNTPITARIQARQQDSDSNRKAQVLQAKVHDLRYAASIASTLQERERAERQAREVQRQLDQCLR